MKKYKFRIIAIAVGAVIVAGIYVFYRIYYNKSELIPEPPAKSETAGSAAAAQTPGKNGRTVPVTVHVADYMTLEEGIRTVGTLRPNEQVKISSEVAGLIDEVTFDEGSFVKKGSLLVKINSDDLQNQLMRTELERDLLKDKLERNRILLEKDAISRETFDQIQTDYNLIEADIQLLKIKIDKTRITAPFDGVIGFREVSSGTYVTAGTLIAEIVDGSRLKLEFAIPEKYISLAKVGAQVLFTIQGSNTVKRARVYAVDSKVDPLTMTIAMRAMYDNSDFKLTPGMFASVMVGQTQSATLQIPTQAVVPSVENNSVWLVRNGRAVSVPVTTGIRGESTVEITKGIEAGDSVIITGLLHVRENSQVQVMN